jgi:hypothetical protein
MTSTKIGRLAAALLATVALGWGGPFSVASLSREPRDGRAVRFTHPDAAQVASTRRQTPA